VPDPVAPNAMARLNIQESSYESSPAGLVVGIGASAGGLEAVSELLRNLPASTGIAFVLVQHLDPHHESILADLLGNCTPMPVTQVQGDVPVKALADGQMRPFSRVKWLWLRPVGRDGFLRPRLVSSNSPERMSSARPASHSLRCRRYRMSAIFCGSSCHTLRPRERDFSQVVIVLWRRERDSDP
jgi:hypothetical protein